MDTFRCLIVLLIAVFTCAQATNKVVEYFKNATLLCDSDTLNITGNIAKHADIINKYWITPSGAKLDNASLPEIVKIYKEFQISPDWYNFSITLNYVSDDDFGVYYCVIVRKDYTIDVARQGLNENGPDYGNLMKKYRHNAMVGGIAAAVLFAIISGSCILWHFRYSQKKAGKGEEIDHEFTDLANGGTSYDNIVVNAEDLNEKL